MKVLRHPIFLRLLHWALATAFVAELLSGLYISNPAGFRLFRSMDSARKTHFIAQYFIIITFLARIYYSILARDYRELLPGRKDLPGLVKRLRYEAYLTREKPKFRKYTPDQKLLFSSWAALFLVQIITGLALYDPKRFTRLEKLLGGAGRVRTAHYIATVGLATTVAGHIYFSFTESLEKLKSIFTGYYQE